MVILVQRWAESYMGSHKGAIVQVTAGAGGVDASDWAAMLLRMLIRYAERKKWKVEVLEETPAEEAGIKGAAIMVTGVQLRIRAR